MLGGPANNVPLYSVLQMLQRAGSGLASIYCVEAKGEREGCPGQPAKQREGDDRHGRPPFCRTLSDVFG